MQDAHETKVLCLLGMFNLSEAGRKPVPEDMLGVKGVFVGGCIATGVGLISSRKGLRCEEAHAHVEGLHQGWVCFQIPADLDSKELRMHELAHIMSGEGHTKAWRAKMTELGQEIPPRYQPRKRLKRSR
jgi:hypothetical protein